MAKVVLKRRRYLDLFVKLIAELPYLHYSEEYQLFIRSYGLDLEKAFAPMAKFSYDDLISKYSSCFNHLSGKELSDKTVMKIAKFKTFKQNIDAILNNFKKLTKKAALARRTYYETFAQLHSQVCLEYEQNVLKGYHNNTPSKNVFTDPNNVAVKKSADKIRESAQTPSWEFLYESLKVESREIEALMEAINQRDKYGSMKIKAQEKQKNTTLELQKILAGKTTIKSFFSRKSIEEEVSTLEGQISKDEKEMEELSMVHDMITLIIAYDEIEKFKKSRLNVYHNTIKAIAQAEIKQVENISNYWDGVIKHEDLNSDNEI